ncbi:MAG: hypothetical protein Kow0022_13910 [Phycisphaerales bacterium]
MLFSEVHPDAMRFIDPVRQAIDWHGLVSEKEARQWRMKGDALFAQLFVLAGYRASAKGQVLLLRDWSHIDYHGVPYQRPTMRPRVVEVLEKQFEVVRTATVRHPIDQYLSLMNLAIMQGVPMPIGAYLDGCLAFAEEAVRIGFVRYEDFTHDPDAHLRLLCDRLDLAFDPTYVDRWAAFEHVTGDTTGTRGGRQEIRPLKRRQADPRLVEKFRSFESYARVKEMLGYEED